MPPQTPCSRLYAFPLLCVCEMKIAFGLGADHTLIYKYLQLTVRSHSGSSRQLSDLQTKVRELFVQSAAFSRRTKSLRIIEAGWSKQTEVPTESQGLFALLRITELQLSFTLIKYKTAESESISGRRARDRGQRLILRGPEEDRCHCRSESLTAGSTNKGKKCRRRVLLRR